MEQGRNSPRSLHDAVKQMTKEATPLELLHDLTRMAIAVIGPDSPRPEEERHNFAETFYALSQFLETLIKEK